MTRLTFTLAALVLLAGCAGISPAPDPKTPTPRVVERTVTVPAETPTPRVETIQVNRTVTVVKNRTVTVVQPTPTPRVVTETVILPTPTPRVVTKTVVVTRTVVVEREVEVTPTPTPVPPPDENDVNIRDRPQGYTDGAYRIDIYVQNWYDHGPVRVDFGVILRTRDDPNADSERFDVYVEGPGEDGTQVDFAYDGVHAENVTEYSIVINGIERAD